MLNKIVERLNQAGARCFLVGGAVRDELFGRESKDFDVEVFGLNMQEIAAILSEFGRVDTVGASFGVVKLTTPDGQDFDFSNPRRDNKTGIKHNDFDVVVDHNMTPREAARRRDFTINALSRDLQTGEIVDFFFGVRDVQNRVLRATDDQTFVQDDLRVLRGMQIASRRRLSTAKETVELCKKMSPAHLAKERIWGEFFKWASKSEVPSIGLQFLLDTGWDAFFPVLSELRDVEQDPVWHPEGDVLEHTKQVVDWSVKFHDPVVTFAALLHDVGKKRTTFRDVDGHVKSPSHAQSSAELAETFMQSIGAPQKMVDQVTVLVREHMTHVSTQASKKAVRRLSHRLAKGGATLTQWAAVVECDHSARRPLETGMPESAQEFMAVAQELDVESQAPKPLVMGRHVTSFVKPGPRMGELLRAAFESQLDGEFETVESGVEWVKAHI